MNFELYLTWIGFLTVSSILLSISTILFVWSLGKISDQFMLMWKIVVFVDKYQTEWIKFNEEKEWLNFFRNHKKTKRFLTKDELETTEKKV